jgi:hypothetical protein
MFRGVHVADGTGRKGVEKSPPLDCADFRFVPTPTRCAGCEFSCFAASMLRCESLAGVYNGLVEVVGKKEEGAAEEEDRKRAASSSSSVTGLDDLVGLG